MLRRALERFEHFAAARTGKVATSNAGQREARIGVQGFHLFTSIAIGVPISSALLITRDATSEMGQPPPRCPAQIQ